MVHNKEWKAMITILIKKLILEWRSNVALARIMNLVLQKKKNTIS